MKLCTCNNCGKVWEDLNPGKDSIEYPNADFPPLEYMTEEGPETTDSYWGCPECRWDGNLNDNINEAAIPRIDIIIIKKILGTDCSEDDSAFIKGWLRETIIHPATDDVERLESIQHYFPLEYGEHLNEEDGEWQPPDLETKVFNAMQGGTDGG